MRAEAPGASVLAVALAALVVTAGCSSDDGRPRAERASAERVADLESRLDRLERRLAALPADEQGLGEAGVEELLARLDSQDPVDRLRAGAELARRGPDVRSEAFARLEETQASERQRRAAALTFALSAERDDVDMLVFARGRTEDTTDRALLAHALGRTGDSDAVEPLVEDLEHDSRLVRAAAALALAELPAAQATLPLLDVAGRDDAVVASFARDAIRSQGQAALLFLEDSWDGLDPRRRERAVEIVADVPAEATVRFLEKRLRDADAHVALAAALALARRGDRQGRTIALAHVGSDDPVIARRARTVLDAYDDQASN